MKLSCISALCVLFLTLAGCGQHNTEVLDKGIIYCSEGSPETFNPQLVTSGTTLDAISRQLYNRLLEFDPANGTLIPSLAEYWLVSEDGKNVTFKLRDGVYFHTNQYFTPSREMNADDVIFSLERWANNDHPYHDIGGGIYPYFDSIQLANSIKNIVRVSSRVIRIELHQANASFLSHFATDFAPILSAEYADVLSSLNKPQLIDSKPIGTGPFYLADYQKDEFIRFKKHQQYWDKTSKIENLVFDITNQSSLRLAKLITKECDVIAYPVTSEMQVLEDSSNVVVQTNPAINVGYWAFNTLKPPFDNPDVRLALAHAVNKQTILRAVYYGSAFAANSVLPTSSWATDSSIEMPEYNLTKARELLTQAGYKNGFEMDIWAMPIERPYNPNAHKMAELIAASLAKVNIKVNVVSYEWNTFRRLLSEHKHDSVLIGWTADSPEPDNFLSPILSCASAIIGANRAAWCNADFDQAVEDALKTTDMQKRIEQYHLAQRILRAEMPVVPIAHSMRYQARQSNISNVDFSSYMSLGFQHVEKAQ